MTFTAKLAEVARSPRGQRVFEEASKLAKDTRSRERIVEAQKSLQDRLPAKPAR